MIVVIPAPVKSCLKTLIYAVIKMRNLILHGIPDTKLVYELAASQECFYWLVRLNKQNYAKK
jgi:hypothetical protein